MKHHPIIFSVIFVSLTIAFLGFVFLAVVFLASDSKSAVFSFGDIAVVKIEGPIFESMDTLRELERYGSNKSIKAIVIRIDSPGGAVAPSQEIFEEVKKLKKDKKVVVSMGTVAASGAYYIASAADKIFASPGTITGSIGVIMESFGLQELARWALVESRIIKSGEYKDAGSPFREMTDKEKAYLQDILNNMYHQFKSAVSKQRGISMEKMDEIAEGKLYTGEMAVKAGLIDGLGTLYDALDEAKKLAGLPKDARIIWPRDEKFPYNIFSSAKKWAGSIDNFTKKYLYGLSFPVWLYHLSLPYPSSGGVGVNN